MESSKKEPSAALLERIRRQVEFYFGDANMQRDTFLQREVKADKGWVPMTTMLRFKLLASMSRDVEVILKALEDSDLIEISEDRTKIRRSINNPVPSNSSKYSEAEQKARTIYVEGFSSKCDIKSLIGHLETTYPVELIFLRKKSLIGGYTGGFNGSLYLQFKTLHDAQKFMDESSIEYEGKLLTKTWAPDSYYPGKTEDDDIFDFKMSLLGDMESLQKALAEIKNFMDKDNMSKNES